MWSMDPFLFVVGVWVTGLYLYGVHVLRRRGDDWPISRVLWFVVAGMGGFFLATQGGISRYDTVLISTHMVQHMILSMWVPLALALGAPVTLALRALPGSTRTGPKKVLLAVLHSRVAKVLSFPPFTLALYVLSPWALYFSGWYDASLTSEYVHQMMHIHLVLVGTLFFWPLLGLDPVPGRVSHPMRLLLLLLTLPFHAFLGITIMDQKTIIGGDHYASLREGPMADWLPSMASDQHLAGAILWASGDAIGMIFFATLFAQWVRSSMKEAEQVDRRLDREEARAAARAAQEGVASDSGPGSAADQ